MRLVVSGHGGGGLVHGEIEVRLFFRGEKMEGRKEGVLWRRLGRGIEE